jgi:cytochrome c oxidase cbb3-type subunit III
MNLIKKLFSNSQIAKYCTAFFALFIFQVPVNAQSSIGQDELVLYSIIGILAAIVLILLLVAFYIVKVMNLIMKDNEAKERAAAGLAAEIEAEKEGWWTRTIEKLNFEKPIEEEEEILLDHNYDGIKELDNHLPPWWTNLFYLTIAFSVVYVLIYHVFDIMPLQEEEYNLAMADAAKQTELRLASVEEDFIDEATVEFVNTSSALTEGATLYTRNCVVCHGTNGEGGIGPNLTDEYWIHGGSISDIFKIIKYGVQEKGMIPWQTSLTPSQMQNLSSYIYTLEGTNPANAKAPEGQIYIREEVSEAATEEEIEESEEEEVEEQLDNE